MRPTDIFTACAYMTQFPADINTGAEGALPVAVAPHSVKKRLRGGWLCVSSGAGAGFTTGGAGAYDGAAASATEEAIMQTNIRRMSRHRARLHRNRERSLHRPARHLQNQGKNASARSILPSNWRPIPSTVMPAAIAFSEPPATQAE